MELLCQGHFFLKKIVGMSLFLLIVTQFCFNYVLLIRLKMRRAALIANTFLFLQLLLLLLQKGQSHGRLTKREEF